MKLFLTWMRWLLHVVLVHDKVIIVAMDESAVCFGCGGKKGNVVAFDDRKDQREEITENLRLADRRHNVTLVGSIVSDSALQPYLPQLILPRQRASSGETAPKSLWPKSIGEIESDAIEVWPECGGWMKSKTLCRYMTCLRKIVNAHRPGSKLVLVYDSHPSHFAADALRHAAKLGIYVVIIPARLGYMLDILDTKVFLEHKRQIHLRAMEHKIEHEVSRLSFQEWVRCVVQATTDVLVDTSYAHEFPRHGLGKDLGNLSPNLKAKVNEADVEARALTAEELNLMLGRATSMHRLLFCGKRFTPSSLAAGAASSSSAAVAVGWPLKPKTTSHKKHSAVH